MNTIKIPDLDDASKAQIFLEIYFPPEDLTLKINEAFGMNNSNVVATVILNEALRLAILNAGIEEPGILTAGSVINCMAVITIPAADAHPAIRAMQSTLDRTRLLPWTTIYVTDRDEGIFRRILLGRGHVDEKCTKANLCAKTAEISAIHNAPLTPLAREIEKKKNAVPLPPPPAPGPDAEPPSPDNAS